MAAALVLTIVGGLHSAVSGLNMVFHARHSMLVDQWVAAMDERALNPSHLKQISVTLTAEQIRQYNQLITALQKVGNLKIPPLSQPAEQSAALSLSQQQAQHVMLVLQYAHPDFENGITSLPMESVEQLLLLTRQCGYGDSRLQPISLFQKPKNLRGVALVPHTLMPLVYKSFTSFGSYGEVFGNPFRAFSAYWKAGVGIDAQGQFRSWFGGPRKARIFFDTNSACEALRNNSVVNMALMISTSEELQALGRAAFDNSSLKKLTLHFKNRVTVADAEQLALILRRQDLMLHKLYLPDAQFETGAVEILDAALRVNGNLHQLKNDQLAGHSSIQRSLARNRAILSADEQKVRSHNIAVAIRNRWLLKVGLPLSILVTLAAATVFVLFCPPLYPIVGIGGMIFYAVYGSVLLELALVAILLGVAEALDFSPSRSANNNLMSARAKEQADTTKTVTMLLSADQQKSAVEMMAKTKDTQSSARNSIESQPSMIGNTPFWKACVSPAMFSLLAVKRSTEVLRDQLWQRTPPPSNMIWQCPISPSADNEIETALSRFTDTETAAQTYAVSMGRV